MPPAKKSKDFNELNYDATSCKRKKTSNKEGEIFEVSEILSYRLDPNNSDVSLQFLVAWKNYGPQQNSWEPLDSLRLNTVFIKYIDDKFNKFEADILVNIANVKEEIKFKRRKVLKNELKVVTMMKRVVPFDPFEFKVHQVVFFLLNDQSKKYNEFMKDLVLRNHFFRLDQVQRIKCDKLAKNMSELENISIVIENDVDFECPSEFSYITKNIYSEDLLIANETSFNQSTVVEPDSTSEIFNDKVKGCECDDCSKESLCCPKLLSLPFAYKETRTSRIVRLNRQEAIIECCENCKCNENCLNRVTQQKRHLSMCLFKSEKLGWCVKTLTPIRKGIFLLEYTGEILGNVEAGKREISSYLFDLNMDRQTHGYYTVDAYKYGNLARFVNHSCEPNSSMWVVSDCTKNPKNQKLCIFTLRDIKEDEEITIDYSPLEGVATSDKINNSLSNIQCQCGSKNCRGTIY